LVVEATSNVTTFLLRMVFGAAIGDVTAGLGHAHDKGRAGRSHIATAGHLRALTET
jgi:hypothetical protein